MKYLDLKTSTGELNVDWRAELITLTQGQTDKITLHPVG